MSDANTQRYLKALHAMQSGVKAEMELGLNDAHTPKHLRVGVNSAMVETGALLKLMLDKGVITEDEWCAALADAMEREVAEYEKRLSEWLHTMVRLG